MTTMSFDGRLYPENIEGLAEWSIRPAFWEGRRPGLSAMLRVKNEAEFLEASVASILDWHDEICIFVQGEQEDDTWRVACGLLSAGDPGCKVKVFHYPFESVHNGPGHHLQPRGSVHERAWFYNWCLAQTSCEFVSKWDGDMVAHDWLGGRVREAMSRHAGVYFAGLDLVGADMAHESARRMTASELRVFRVTPSTFYFTHLHCEHIAATALEDHKIEDVERIREPAFLHLKWCKASLRHSGVGWPEDWETADPYYRQIREAKAAARPYRGPWPKALQALRETRRAAA